MRCDATAMLQAAETRAGRQPWDDVVEGREVHDRSLPGSASSIGTPQLLEAPAPRPSCWFRPRRREGAARDLPGDGTLRLDLHAHCGTAREDRDFDRVLLWPSCLIAERPEVATAMDALRSLGADHVTFRTRGDTLLRSRPQVIGDQPGREVAAASSNPIGTWVTPSRCL